MMMQMAAMVAGMSAEQRAAVAAQTGMPIAQLNQVRHHRRLASAARDAP